MFSATQVKASFSRPGQVSPYTQGTGLLVAGPAVPKDDRAWQKRYYTRAGALKSQPAKMWQDRNNVQSHVIRAT